MIVTTRGPPLTSQGSFQVAKSLGRATFGADGRPLQPPGCPVLDSFIYSASIYPALAVRVSSGARHGWFCGRMTNLRGPEISPWQVQASPNGPRGRRVEGAAGQNRAVTCWTPFGTLGHRAVPL